MGQSKSKSKSFHWQFINQSDQDIINSKCYYGTVKNHTARVQNLEGLRISSNGTTVREEASLQLFLGCSFYMTLSFSNGTTDEFRISLPSKETVDFSYLEGSHCVTCNRSSASKVSIKIENNQEEQDDEKAKGLNKEGEIAIEQKQYEAALKIFEEALNLAKQDLTVDDIEKNKGRTCNQFGKECLERAWDLERDITEDMEEVEDMFVKAKYLFQEAQTLGALSHHQDFEVINLKIAGNRLFKEASELDKEASRTCGSGESEKTVALNKYKEALVKYEAAAEKFEQGVKIDSKFNNSLKIANDHAQDVKKILEDINKVESGQ